MKVGVVAEGPSDVAVVLNILFGKLGVERRDIVPIRPELTTDETDLSEKRAGGYKPPSKKSFSNWQLVLGECADRTSLSDFLDSPIDEPRLLVVQIDTAEAHLAGFDVARPDHDAGDYVAEMRSRVVAKLAALLGEDLTPRTRFAVAVEEIDAWVLTLYAEDGEETGRVKNPKKKLEFALSSAPVPRSKSRSPSGRGATKSGDRPAKKSLFELYHERSAPLRDGATLETCKQRNRSLAMFVDSLAGD
ncbi:MAG: hypothetical protein U0441_06350 [Polyangiaceae bacterium]